MVEADTAIFEATISQEVAFDKAMAPIREFMFKHTRQKDLAVFIRISDGEKPANKSEVSNWQLIPAFVLSELKTARWGSCCISRSW